MIEFMNAKKKVMDTILENVHENAKSQVSQILIYETLGGDFLVNIADSENLRAIHGVFRTDGTWRVYTEEAELDGHYLVPNGKSIELGSGTETAWPTGQKVPRDWINPITGMRHCQ